MQFNSLSNYAESLKFITFVVFLVFVIKAASHHFEKMDDIGLCAVNKKCNSLFTWFDTLRLLTLPQDEGRHFDSGDDIIAAVDHFVEVRDTDFNKEEMWLLHEQSVWMLEGILLRK